MTATIKNTPEIWHCVYEQSPIGIGFLNKDGFFIDVNQRLCSILEYTLDELQNINISELTHPSDIQSDIKMMQRITSGELGGYEMLKRYITKTGKIVWAKLSVWPIKNSDGTIMYLKQIQPVNGDKYKMEQVGPGSLQIRPAISMIEFIADNWKSFVAAFAIIISTVIGLGVTVYSMDYEIKRMRQDMQTIIERQHSNDPSR